MTLTQIALAALLGASPPAGLTKHATPTWVVYGTAYCPGRPDIDPPCGGPNAAWTGQLLRNYHAAVDPKVIPYGTKLWAGAPVNRILLAVDCGGAIKGQRVDFAEPNPKWYYSTAAALEAAGHRVNVWRVGKLTRQQARAWKPSEVAPR